MQPIRQAVSQDYSPFTSEHVSLKFDRSNFYIHMLHGVEQQLFPSYIHFPFCTSDYGSYDI